MNKIVLIFISLLFFTSSLVAQQKLSLKDCLDILFKQSVEYKMLELQKDKNKLNYTISSMFKYPTMDFSLAVPLKYSQNVQDVFNSELNQYILILNNSNLFSPNASLSSNYNLPTGGTIKLNLGTYYNTYNSTFSKDRENFRYLFSAGLSHPLFKTNEYRIKFEQKEKQFQQTKLNFLKAKNDLIFKTIEKYYDVLLKQKQLSLTIRKQAKENEELKEQKLKFKLGKISKVDLINKNLEIKNSELIVSKSKEELRRQMNDFISLLGLDENKPVELEELVEFIPFNIQLNEALNLAVKNNPDFKILKIDSELNQLNYEIKNTSNIEMNLNASALFSNQLYYRPFDKKLKSYDYGLGITVKIPIMDGGKRNAEIELSKIALEEIKNTIVEKEKSLKLIVKKYFSAIDYYKKEYLLQKEKLNILKDSYNVFQKEYTNGRLTFFELQNHKNAIYEVEKKIIETVINYNKNILQLKIILGQEIL